MKKKMSVFHRCYEGNVKNTFLLNRNVILEKQTLSKDHTAKRL